MTLLTGRPLFFLRAHPVVASLLRYGFVVGACVAVFAGSGGYVSNSAMKQITVADAAEPAPTTPMAPVSVPDTPVLPTREAVAAPKPAIASPYVSAVASTSAPATASEAVPAPEAVDVAYDETAQTDLPGIANDVEPLPASSSEVLFARTGVNIHARPSNGGAKLGILRAGQRVEVVERDGGWVQVADSAGVLGWVYGSFLTTEGSGNAPRRSHATTVSHEAAPEGSIIVFPDDNGGFEAPVHVVSVSSRP
jgi:hypothetical protein